MNRRGFIKRGALWVPAIVGLKAYPQALTLADPARVLGSSSVAESIWVQQTTDNDYWTHSANGTMSQYIVNSISRNVSKIELKVGQHGVDTETVYIQLRSGNNGGGTQYGSDSSQITINSSYSTAAFATFTFSSAVNVTGNFYINLVRVGTSDFRWRGDSHTLGAAGYPYTDATDDAAYCGFTGIAARTTFDYCFKIYTQ